MKRPARISTPLLLWSGLAILLLAGIAYAARTLALPRVQVTRPVRGPVVQAFYATGTVAPEREYAVRSNVAGILFLEAGIDKGVAVIKDQLLGRVVSDDLEKKLKQAQAELKEKQQRADEKTSPVLQEYDKREQALTAIHDIAEREYKRLLQLSESNNAQVVEIERALDRIKTVWSELEVVKAQRATKRLELQKDLEMAQSAYGIAKWNIDQQEIKAPIDGVILDWPVPNRTRVAINDDILTMADVRPEKLVMRAAVDEEDKNKLHVGQTVKMTLYAFEDDKFLGRVKTIYPKADPQRRTFEVDVEIEHRAFGTTTAPTATTRPDLYARFAPGLTGELAFVEQSKDEATILPRQALQGDWFYVVRDGRIDRIPAQAGVRNVTRVEVLGGVPTDALVLISPIGKMEPGQAVRTQFIDPRVAADLNKPNTEIFRGGF
ncbi:MAG TPA: efflux RND transporter periplasmic adaptor subunit [Tepidisphaeraceae bacterium]|jgi:multidrug efflux pump subunit AcrA (membrane-fusion protein)